MSGYDREWALGLHSWSEQTGLAVGRRVVSWILIKSMTMVMIMTELCDSDQPASSVMSIVSSTLNKISRTRKHI